MKKILSLLLSLFMVFSMAGCSTTEGSTAGDDSSVITGHYEAVENTDNGSTSASSQANDQSDYAPIDKDGHYFDKENVALYIYTYGELPANFITKDQARKLGWEGGNVEAYAPGCAIGGDKFGNYEELLPTAKGRQYYECDIDTDGYHSRGSRRIVFSNDGLIYYTHDHYESFELLYGKE